MANNFGNIFRRITSLFLRMSDSTDEIFVGTKDRFKGVTVNTATEPEYSDDKKIEKRLLDSLECWIQDGVRGVWFRVSLAHTNWIPVLAKHGFVFHHANPEYVMMIRWLPSDEKSAVPSFPHNFVGVGALVYSEGQVLVVKEKFYDKPQWKFPGGYVELGVFESHKSFIQTEKRREYGTNYSFTKYGKSDLKTLYSDQHSLGVTPTTPIGCAYRLATPAIPITTKMASEQRAASDGETNASAIGSASCPSFVGPII